MAKNRDARQAQIVEDVLAGIRTQCEASIGRTSAKCKKRTMFLAASHQYCRQHAAEVCNKHFYSLEHIDTGERIDWTMVSAVPRKERFNAILSEIARLCK